MVALLLYLGNVIDTDLGIREETVAHPGRIQHHVGVDFMHGTSTAFGVIICRDSSLSRDFL